MRLLGKFNQRCFGERFVDNIMVDIIILAIVVRNDKLQHIDNCSNKVQGN